jgi:hypothetical protein
MPEISRFFGIIVAMFYNDHSPPHFHVRYGDDKAIIAIESLRLLEGKLKPRTLGLVIEWASLHQAELMDDWQLARTMQPLKSIQPLE